MSPTYKLAIALIVALFVAAPLAVAATLDELLPQVVAYEYEKDAAPLEQVTELLVQAQSDTAAMHAMAAKLAAQLPSATEAAKLYICRQIYMFGDDQCIQHVAPLLLKQETVDIACYALGRMPGLEATKAQVAALGKADPAAKVALLNALGQRREEDVVDVLAKAARDADPAVSRAAILALGETGALPAARALENLWTPVAKDVEAAMLDAAEKIAAKDSSAGAGIYQKLFDNTNDPAVKGAALKALALLPDADALDWIDKGLRDQSLMIRTAAAEALRQLDDERLAANARKLVNYPPDAQVMVINVLGDRALENTWAPVLAMTHSQDDWIRLAAIGALGKVGDTHCVMRLAELAAGDNAEDAKAARRSLAIMKGPLIDPLLASDLHTGTNVKLQIHLMQALADRRAHDQIETVLEMAAKPDENLRQAAFKTLAELATREDLPAMIDLLAQEPADAPRAQAEAAIVAVARKVSAPFSPTAAVTAAWPATAENVPARCALARVLGKLGDDKTLDLLRADLAAADGAVQEAVLRAMADWPSPAPLDDVRKMAESATGSLKQIALRGFIRLIGLPSDRPVDQTVALYDKSLNLAADPSEKVAALAGLADCPCDEGVALIKRYLDDPQVAAEAKLALEKATKPRN